MANFERTQRIHINNLKIPLFLPQISLQQKNGENYLWSGYIDGCGEPAGIIHILG